MHESQLRNHTEQGKKRKENPSLSRDVLLPLQQNLVFIISAGGHKHSLKRIVFYFAYLDFHRSHCRMTGGVIIYVKAVNLCGHCAIAIQQGCSVVAIAKTNNQTIWYTAFRKRKLHVGNVCICGPNRDPPHDGNLQTSSSWSTNKLLLKPPQRNERDSASYSWNGERIFVDNLVDVFSLHEAMETLSNRITSFKYDFPSSVVHILAWLPQTTSSQAENGS